MKHLLTLILLLTLATGLFAAEFDIKQFTNPKKYNWNTYEERMKFRIDLNDRQELLQIYNMRKQSLTTNLIKSAFFPGWGQITAHSYIRGQVILGVEIISLGGSIFLYTKAMDKYNKYLDATQVDEINSLYEAALEPYTLSMALFGLYALIWGYNLYDSIQATEAYNGNLWNSVVEEYSSRKVTVTPTGIKVRF
ncbi:MAG: hypothetical protein JXR56_02560 [Candidatus Cloacimonetes bacterium]|nr:hypothetical protein [Candidatus Cloacimonadota bacterium]